MQVISVQPITDRPIIDAIATNDFMLIGDASDGNTIKRVTVSSLKAFVLAGLPSTPPPTPPIGFALRINCGGDRFVDGDGKIWNADIIYRTTGGAFTGSSPVLSELYLTEAYDFGYSIPLENGSYTVKLGFAELDPRERIFSVSLNGQIALTNYSIAEDVGMGAVAIKSFVITISNGSLVIESSGVNEQGSKICAIEILGS
jgi:hypothetical protein